MSFPKTSIKQYEIGSGHRILAGKMGTLYSGKRGSIIVAKAAVVGIDDHLWMVAQILVEQMGFCMLINSIDTGTHAPDSRHFVGCAFDTDMIGVDHTHLRAVNVLSSLAVQAATWLHSQGFEYHEMGPHAAVLLGPVHSSMNETGSSHVGHMHISIQRPPGATAVSETEAADS